MAPKPGGDILTLTNGTLTISDGNLGGPLIYSNLAIVTNKLVNQTMAGNPTNQLSAEFSLSTGVVSLSFRPTGAHTSTVAQGVVLQDNTGTNAAGWYFGAGQSGWFLLQQ
jgi:hypothetical protein